MTHPRTHSRFAYETGLKCLYPNYPGNISFVTSHREKGENYGHTLGQDSELISEEIIRSLPWHEIKHWSRTEDASFLSFDRLLPQRLERRNEVAFDLQPATYKQMKREVMSAVAYLPSVLTISMHQFDFNLRRAGSLGAQKVSDEN
jgi:hypothetical protein